MQRDKILTDVDFSQVEDVVDDLIEKLELGKPQAWLDPAQQIFRNMTLSWSLLSPVLVSCLGWLSLPVLHLSRVKSSISPGGLCKQPRVEAGGL